jgi:hypothetical protein
MTIPEACSLVLEAGCTGKGGEIYIFDMGEAVKIYDLAEKMIRLSGKIPHEDIRIVETGLREGEKLYEELLATTENTIPTYHKKVLIAKVRQYDYDIIHPAIKELLYTANKYVYPDDVVKKLKKLVREFKSTNSQRFEQSQFLQEVRLYWKQLQGVPISWCISNLFESGVVLSPTVVGIRLCLLRLKELLAVKVGDLLVGNPQRFLMQSLLLCLR